MSQGVPTPIPDCLPRDHPGKPTFCTDSLIALAEAQLKKAGYPTVVLESLGISGSNHNKWLEYATRDEQNGLTEEESQYIKYRQAVQRAVAARELSLASLVANAAASGPQYWPAGMTYLERRHPDRWGRRDESRQGANAPVQIQIINYHGAQAVPLPAVEVRELPPATSD